jgi:hypothetical protein
MNKIRLFAVLLLFTLSTGGGAAAENRLAPGEKSPSPGPGSQKALEKEEAIVLREADDSERINPKASARKGVVQKAGAAGVVVKKGKEAATDKITE